MVFLRLGCVAIGPGAATLVRVRKRRIRHNGIPVPWIADVDDLARIAINGNEMPAAAIPGNAQAKRAALIDLGLDTGHPGLATGDSVEIAHDLQSLIEEPRLITFCRAAISAAGRLPHRSVRDRALGLTAGRVVIEVHRHRNRCPAPLRLLLGLHRETERIAASACSPRAMTSSAHGM